jgi:Zn-dependent protease with chaperone function
MKVLFADRLLPQHHPAVHLLRTVGARVLRGELRRQDSTAHKWQWEYYIIDDPAEMNAFVLPGGKVGEKKCIQFLWYGLDV